MYQIQATLTKATEAGFMIKQIPTFYLDPGVQGIVSADHARRIAEEMLNPFKDESVRVSVNAILTTRKESHGLLETTIVP